LSPKAEEKLRAALGQYVTFRAANPTGHYAFALSSLVDHSVCSRLLDLAREEGGATFNVRNLTYEGGVAVRLPPVSRHQGVTRELGLQSC
jgi:hypothetical protein